MKKLLLVLCLLTLLGNPVDAQIQNKLSVDVIVGRFAKGVGYFTQSQYRNDVSFMNGFIINYHYSEKFSFLLGLKK